MPTAAMPGFTSPRDSETTVAAREVPAVGTIPETGGQEHLVPVASLLLTASVLALAVLRRWRRL